MNSYPFIQVKNETLSAPSRGINQASHNRVNKTAIKLTLFAVTLVQMGMFALMTVLSDISAAFPGTSDQAIQFMATFSTVLIATMSLAVIWLSRLFDRKNLLIVAQLFCVISGVGGFLFHSNLALLYVWAAFLGSGVGLFIPLLAASAADYFTGVQRAKVMGGMSSYQTLGGVLMSILGGVIAVRIWSHIYLVLLIAVIGLVCTIMFLPKAPPKRKATKEKTTFKLDKTLVFFSLAFFMFSVFYNAGPVNFSMMVQERNLGGASLSGMLIAVFLLGGVCMGFFFDKINTKIGKLTAPLAMLIMATGYIVLGLSHSLTLSLLSIFLSGASISLLLPQVFLQVVKGRTGQDLAAASAVANSVGCLGSFFAPTLTGLASRVTSTDFVANRMIFSGIGAIIIGLIFLPFCVKAFGDVNVHVKPEVY